MGRRLPPPERRRGGRGREGAPEGGAGRECAEQSGNGSVTVLSSVRRCSRMLAIVSVCVLPCVGARVSGVRVCVCVCVCARLRVILFV